MSLLTLFGLNLSAPLPVIRPENAFIASARARTFSTTSRLTAFAAAARVRAFTAGG